jgi:hypothetical protein
MKNFIFLVSILIIGKTSAQTDTSLVSREDHLVLLLNDLRTAENDADKKARNKVFKEYLAETITLEGAFNYPFSKLKTVGFVDSPDGLIRIINWNVEQDDQSQKYCCYILRFDPKKKNVEISELIDNSFMLPPRPDGILDANNWYGALYYKIIPIEKGSKTMYTLLGWDGNNSMSTVKLIDVLYFSGDNPKLGSPIFKTKETTLKRYFFEHSKKTVMSLKYEDQYKRLIFDHLSPESPNLAGFYSFYVPDLSLDAFVLEGNKWILKEDVIGINKESDEKTEVFVKNERTGKVEKKLIKNKWESPEDVNAPDGGGQHIAVLPENDLENPEAQKEELNKKASKRDKRNPGDLEGTLGKQRGRNRTRN